MSSTGEGVVPVDGMEFDSGRILCPCGDRPYLWFNGGELDRQVCKCGRVYWTEHASIVLRVGYEYPDPR